MTNSLGNSISRVGLVGEWLLDGNALDTSGNGNNGENLNGVYVKTYNGYQSQSWKGNGSNASVTIASGLGITNGIISIDVTFTPLTIPTNGTVQTIVSKSSATVHIQYNIHYINSSGTYYLQFTRDKGNVSAEGLAYSLPSALIIGKKYKVTLIYDGSNIHGYLDGVPVGSSAVNGNGASGYTNVTTIGRLSSSSIYYANMIIQGVRIYNRVLSQEEIQLLYLEGQKLLGPTHIAKYPKLFEGLVGYWDFRGTAHNLVDGVAGTVTGATLTQDRFGNAASAYSFDGISNRILLGNNFGYTGNSDWSVTLELYINSGTISGTKILYSTENSSTSNRFDVYYNNTTFYAGKVKRAIQDAPSIPYSSIPKDQWFTLTLVYNSSNSTSYIYINGSSHTSGVISGNGSGGTLNVTNLGCDHSQTLFSENKTGLLLIQNKALSADEVKLLYTLTSQDYIYPNPSYDLPNLRDGLVLDLNEQGKDLSGNGNDGTLVNSPTVVRQGKAKGLTYNGSNQYIQKTSASITLSEITINIWTKQISTATDKILIKLSNGVNSEIFLDFNSNTAGSFQVKSYIDGGAKWIVGYNNSGIPNGTPTMITFVAGSNYNRFYINGIQVPLTYNQGSSSTGINTKTYNSYTVGAGSGNNYNNASQFNPRIRNRALSNREIQQLYYSQKGNYCY